MTHVVVRVAKSAGLIALFIIVAMLGILSGVLFAYAGDLPQVSALDNYAPSTITRIYSNDNRVIGEFATERREVVGYDDINPLLRQDHRDRGRGLRPARWRERLAYRRRRAHRHPGTPAGAGRQHAHPAARAQPEGSVRLEQREVIRTQDSRSNSRDSD